MGLDLNFNLLRSLLILGTVVEARDPYTGGHVWRVAEYSKLLAEKAGLSADEIFKSYISGYLHDIGKIVIPDAVLNKTTSLTREEFELVKTHTTVGSEIIRAHPFADLIKDAVLHHHERIDGKGYPDALEGDRIEIITRIVSIADTFDAITSVRPYKERMPSDKAVFLLNGQRGKRFDDNLITILIDAVENGEADPVIGKSSPFRPMAECKECGPVIAIGLSKKDGDVVCCNVCSKNFRAHANGNFFDLEQINDQNVFVSPDIDYMLIDKIVDSYR